MKTIVIGTLAHVDAGKTTLSESLLYTSGNINTLGRVDHGNAFFDYDPQERARGITIFSKQALLHCNETKIILMDTPGHVDFSTEMERTLQILDYAILVINGVDGIQAHSETIWNLLKHYRIPTFLFVNKMDIALTSKQVLMGDIKAKLSNNCIDFTQDLKEILELVALSNEERFDYYLQHQDITVSMIKEGIQKRELFPCFFGSALKMDGIDEFLKGLDQYTSMKQYPLEFGAKVFKITRDKIGNKLTHIKVTGGSLKVKAQLFETEKVDQIRLYSGDKFQSVNEVLAGDVCALKGLKHLQVGEGLGFEHTTQIPYLTSFLNYRLILPEGSDPFTMLKYLGQLREEDPQLQIRYNTRLEEIRIQVMGEIQIEILKNIIEERFHVAVMFDEGLVNYKETIIEKIEGVGHYEPLRHYAEVHLRLEPGERGSGIQIYNECSVDMIDRTWQKRILSHIEEKEHLGVLTGSPITDIKIILLGAKAHLTHTEGGDFREATYRAIRHGLKRTKNILLEPYYQFRLQIPRVFVSKAIFDIEQMQGSYNIETLSQDEDVIIGTAPVSKMQRYLVSVPSYTKGRGRISCQFQGYGECKSEMNTHVNHHYDSETDADNPTGSIFCAHGAGFFVPWNEVAEHMHIDWLWTKKENLDIGMPKDKKTYIDDKELERVFTRIYGSSKRRLPHKREVISSDLNTQSIMKRVPEYLLVDGYNIIYSWDELKVLANTNMEAARLKLKDMMCNYQGFKQCILILVFDAYKVKENLGTMRKEDNIFVVYTKTKQTADSYIEQVTHQLANDYRIIVATSDAMEQLIVTGQGARRMSARDLKLEIERVQVEEMKELTSLKPQFRNHALEGIRILNEVDLQHDDEISK